MAERVRKESDVESKYSRAPFVFSCISSFLLSEADANGMKGIGVCETVVIKYR